MPAQGNLGEIQRGHHLEKLAINDKIRGSDIEYVYPLRKPWGSYSDVVRDSLTHQVHVDLERWVRYGLSKRDVELMLRMICCDHGQNKGATKRNASRKATEAGEGNSDGRNHPPSGRRSPVPPSRQC